MEQTLVGVIEQQPHIPAATEPIGSQAAGGWLVAGQA